MNPEDADDRISWGLVCVLCGKYLWFWQRQEHTYFIDDTPYPDIGLPPCHTPFYYKVHKKCRENKK